jgi:hypothetical protein
MNGGDGARRSRGWAPNIKWRPGIVPGARHCCISFFHRREMDNAGPRARGPSPPHIWFTSKMVWSSPSHGSRHQQQPSTGQGRAHCLLPRESPIWCAFPPHAPSALLADPADTTGVSFLLFVATIWVLFYHRKSESLNKSLFVTSSLMMLFGRLVSTFFSPTPRTPPLTHPPAPRHRPLPHPRGVHHPV